VLPDFDALRDGNRTFTALAAYYHRPVTLTGTKQPEQLPALVISSGFLDVLGIRRSVGRGFSHDDEQWGRSSRASAS
jgi:hypothetical protein